jgi:hypothetical protein
MNDIRQFFVSYEHTSQAKTPMKREGVKNDVPSKWKQKINIGNNAHI